MASGAAGLPTQPTRRGVAPRPRAAQILLPHGFRPDVETSIERQIAADIRFHVRFGPPALERGEVSREAERVAGTIRSLR